MDLRPLEQVARYAVARLPLSEEDKRDAVQDALLALVRRTSPFEGRSKASTWMHSVARNAGLMRMREERKQARRAERAWLLELPPPQACPEARARATEALGRLLPREREVFVGAEMMGETMAEVALRTGLSESSVHRDYVRARARLRATAA